MSERSEHRSISSQTLISVRVTDWKEGTITPPASRRLGWIIVAGGAAGGAAASAIVSKLGFVEEERGSFHLRQRMGCAGSKNSDGGDGMCAVRVQDGAGVGVARG